MFLGYYRDYGPRKLWKKINKEIKKNTDILTFLYYISDPQTAECNSYTHTERILGHKTNLNQFLKYSWSIRIMFLKTITLNWKSIERSVKMLKYLEKKCNIQNSTVEKKYRRKLENILNWMEIKHHIKNLLLFATRVVPRNIYRFVPIVLNTGKKESKTINFLLLKKLFCKSK